MDLTVTGAVIREAPIGESDKIITILTPEYGKITFRAKGVKSIKSKNAAGTQIFCYSEFELMEKGGRYSLKTAYVKQSFFGIRSDVLRYSLACYMLDTVNAVTTEQNDETEILRLLLNALYALSEKQDIPLWKIKGAYELKLMELCGFMPELYTCLGCGGETLDNTKVFFSFTEAQIVCQDCKKLFNTGLFSVSHPTLLAMRNILEQPSQRLVSFNLSQEYSEEFAFLCENYLINQTERNYQTLRIYKSMQNTLNYKSES